MGTSLSYYIIAKHMTDNYVNLSQPDYSKVNTNNNNVGSKQSQFIKLKTNSIDSNKYKHSSLS